MKNINTKHVFILILGVAAALASIISLRIGLQQSVWFDEAYSVLLAEHSWVEIARLTAQDVHPPVYYWLLKVWMLLFGSSELALRSMSALLLGLSIIVAGLFIRRLFGTRIAVVTLPFLVFAPFLLRYGFEIRMYALCSLIGISATYLLVAAVEETKKKRRWSLLLAYGCLVALGVYTLYFMALLWIAHLAWVAWLVYKEGRRDLLKPAVITYGFAFLLFTPWLPVFFSKAGGATLSAVTNKLDFENLYGMLTYLFLYRPPWDVKGVAVFVVVAIIAALVVLWYRGYKNASKKERQYLALIAMYFFVPVVILVIVTQLAPIYIERYTAHIAVGLYSGIGVLSGLALRNKDKWGMTAAGALLVVLILGSSSLAQFGNYNFQRIHTPSVKQIAALLGDCNSGAVIFADGPQVAMELMYYERDCPVYFFNETLEMGGGFAMLSGTSLRVANASELPDTHKIFHIYYNEPKNTIPSSFRNEDVVTVGAVRVATYVADGVY